KWRKPLVQSIDFAFWKDDERLAGRQQFDRQLDGAPVAAFTVHAERAHALQAPAVQSAVRPEDLPGSHEIEPSVRPSADLHHDVRIAVVTMIGGYQRAVARTNHV